MIRITKPGRVPRVLKTKGRAQREANCREYLAHSTAFNSGDGRFKLDPAIYAHDEVKQALIKAQHDKCCFCESKITHVSFGDIEHFRPKKGFRQKRSDKLGRPGYYWLAYDWSNLFLSCELCNRRHKANLFPLANPDERALCHTDDLAKEQPLFVNPSEEEPADHIAFEKELAVPVKRSKKGRTTINELRLNRPALQARRRDRYKTLSILRAVAEANPPIPETEDAKSRIAVWQSDAGEYASMVRCALRTRA